VAVARAGIIGIRQLGHTCTDETDRTTGGHSGLCTLHRLSVRVNMWLLHVLASMAPDSLDRTARSFVSEDEKKWMQVLVTQRLASCRG
jgi:hypothetical protein